MSEWTQEEVEDTLGQIMARARVDKGFRQICLTNPEKAVNMISGKDMTKGKTIQFVENKGTHQVFVLPNLLEEELHPDKSPDELPWYCPELKIQICK